MRSKLLELRTVLHAQFLERDEVVDGLLTALLAREHVLLLGPPGTAKSLLASTICTSIAGATYFQKLLTKFSTDKELFVKDTAIEESQLDHGRKRILFMPNVAGMLPDAHIGFLDEIFKCNSATLNSLLTLLNERRYHTSDGRVLDCPLQTLIGASNEPPARGEGLEALSDRFLFRYEVGYISSTPNFLRMLELEGCGQTVVLTLDELVGLQREAMATPIPGSVLETVAELRSRLDAEGISASDRRYKLCLKVVKAHAYLHGHDTVRREDLAILQHCLWGVAADGTSELRPADVAKIRKIVLSVVVPLERDAREIFDSAKEIFGLASRVQKNEENSLEKLIEYSMKLRELDAKLSRLAMHDSRGDSSSKVAEYAAQVSGFRDNVVRLVTE